MIMQNIFLWFYCLPVTDVVMLVIMATAVYLYLRESLEKFPYWKAGVFLMLLCWVAVILFATLDRRMEGSNQTEPVLIPFYSYYTVLIGGNREIYRSNLMNVILFYPAGLLMNEVLPEKWSKIRCVILVTAFFLLASISIEYIQYRFAMGLTEIDDVIHNTLGTLIGALAGCISPKSNR